MSETNDKLQARLPGMAIDSTDSAPSEFMWMPGGVHEVTLDRKGKPHNIHIEVNAQTAATMQATLESYKAAGSHRPYFDFSHGEDRASAWPVAFVWRGGPAPGVYAQVEWSDEGAQAVQGKSYRAFSPSFFASPHRTTLQKPATVFGAPFVMGGLVNDPAFQKISPLWARNAAGARTQSSARPKPKQKDNCMTQDELAALQAKRTELEQTIETLRAKNQDAETAEALQAAEGELEGVRLQAENAELRAQNQEHENRLKAQRQADAEAAVDEAVRLGKIPSRDEALRAKWVEKCAADPEQIKLLAKLPGHPAIAPRLTRPITSRSARVEITMEDLGTVLRAYNGQPDHHRRGNLYAKELRARMVQEVDCLEVLKAANALGTLPGALIVQRSLDLLKIDFPLFSRISTNLTDRQYDPSVDPKYNEPITTRLIGVPAVASYDTANGYVDQDAVATDVQVTPDAHRFTQVTFNANEISGTRRLLFGEQEAAMHYAIGLDFITAIYALFIAANYTEAASDFDLANFDRTSVIAIGKAMQAGGRNANFGTRTLLLNSDFYGALSEDTTVVSNLNNRDAGSAIATGMLPMVHGFLPVEAPNLPTTGNLVGFGMRSDAVAIAAGVPIMYANSIPGVPSTALQQLVTNPDTGLTVQLTAFVDHKLGRASMRVAWIRGQAVGNLKAGQLVTDTP